jgi:O-antigen biosynthesis protein WbqV
MSRISKVLVHLSLVFGAFLLAYAFRLAPPPSWWLHDPAAKQVYFWAGLYALVAAAVELVFRDERASWRFTSLPEVLTLARSTGLTAAIFLVVVFMGTRAFSLPRSVVILAWVFSLAALVGVRTLLRLSYDPTLLARFLAGRRLAGAPLALVGELRHADSYLRHVAADDRYRVVAIVAKSKGDKGQFVAGVPVIGDISGLTRADALRALRTPVLPALLFLDDPIKSLGLATEDIGRLRRDGYKLLRQPSVVELRMEESGAQTLRTMNLEEFLPRAPVTLDPASISQLVRGKRVMVTGAGGSIGSEIARQVAAFDCSHLSLLDHSEFSLFEIHRALDGAPHPDLGLSAVLCNVREEERVREAFLAAAPDIVFHAAALKHVTMVENNPCEGVLTNIVGTANVMAAAAFCGASQMVMVSTDKAVAPTCVMGATKRIAESLLPAEGQGVTRYCVVRFGNVLGSTGSVVPIFQAEIEAGGPVRVTHPDVERYFMTIQEAVQLVLHAAALSSAGPDNSRRKFALDMGSPVKIVDLARQMIELSGRRPDIDIAIQFIGLRPGEKMAEALIDSNEIEANHLPGVSEIAPRTPEGRLTPELVAKFKSAANAGDDQAVRGLITEALSSVRRGAEILYHDFKRRVVSEPAAPDALQAPN